MKRTTPAATPPSPPVQPHSENQPPTAASEKPSEGKVGRSTSPATNSIKLGLSTTEPVQPPGSAAPPAPQPKKSPPLEPTQVPPILLEGDEPKPVVGSGTERKFTGPSKPETGQTEPGSQGLPESYGTGRLLLTARDPNCLYAHWDLTAKQQEAHLSRSAQKHLHLRVHQESLSGPVVSEVQVPAQAHHSFVSVDAPGARRFVADLGYYPEGGSWKSVAAGETTLALAPPPVPAPFRFTTLSFGSAGQPPGTAGHADAGRPEAATQGTGIPMSPPAKLSFPLPKSVGLGSRAEQTSIGEVVPPEQAQNWRELPTDQLGLAVFGDLADEISTEPTQMLSRLSGQWTAAQERALAELIGWSVLRNEPFWSGRIEELIRGNSPTSKVTELGAQSPPSSVAVVGLPGQEQGFWFNLNAELVIYGSTQPNATVTIGGRPIALRADGTFSYRFTLPDGQYHLPLAARSAQGEQREATLNFHRATSYSEGVGEHPQDPGLKSPVAENIS